MKSFITPAYTFVPGIAGTGTVDLSAIAAFDVKRLVAVINQTKGILIYSTASAALKYVSEVAGVITLSADTSTMLGSDKLQVVYENLISSVNDSALLTELQLKADLTDVQPVSVSSLPLPLGAATQTTLSALNGKLPATLGAKPTTASLSVTLASDQVALPVTGAFFQATQPVSMSTIPVGASTSAKQDLLLAELQLKADLTETQPVSVAALPLPTGAATAAKQDLLLAELQLKADLTQTQPVSGAFFQATQPVSMVAIPVGAATSAKQDLLLSELQLKADLTETQPVSMAVAPIPLSVAGTITNAKITVGITAVRATVAGTAPSASRKKLMIKPHKDNTGAIYLGASTVTTANGLEIIGPDRLEFVFDAGDYYVISDVAAQSLEIIEKV